MKKTTLAIIVMIILGTAAEAVSWYRYGWGWRRPYRYGYWGWPYRYRRPLRRRVVYVQQPRRQRLVVQKAASNRSAPMRTQQTQPKQQQVQPTTQQSTIKKALPTISAKNDGKE